ncbi:MAG: FKBP-type peptidyl-prolyl cis-trans isomerase [Candidatus Symbiothrix sp.]|nr:FKBP-type peptidyl-prolyl cis-trans isomerase [Candidatus Symbiothrix sp.]
MMGFAMISFISCNAQAPKASLNTDIDSLSYALGINISQGLDQYMMQMNIDSAYVGDVISGFTETINLDKENKKTNAHLFGQQIGQQISQMMEGMNQNFFGEDSTRVINKNNLISGFIASVLKQKLLINEEDAQAYVTTVGNKLREEAFEKQHVEEKEANAKFLEENKSKEGVVTLPSGLQYKVVKAGTGANPAATETVKVNYVGTTIDGKEFDTTVKDGKAEPREFPLNSVIAGWTEGIQLMPVGSKYIFYVPYDLAYGSQGRPGSIPPYATLIFDVDLLDIVKK